MEEILPILRDRLRSKIRIEYDDVKLTVIIKIKGKLYGRLVYPGEIQTMLKMFGGLKHEIPITTKSNEKDQSVTIEFENITDYNLIKPLWGKMLENAFKMLSEVLKGNYEIIRDIPNIDD